MSYAQRHKAATASPTASKFDRSSGSGGIVCSTDDVATRGGHRRTRTAASPVQRRGTATPGKASGRATPGRSASSAGGRSPVSSVRSRAVEVREPAMSGRDRQRQWPGSAAASPKVGMAAPTALAASPSWFATNAGPLEQLSAIFHQKLSGLMDVRAQIEALTAKHREGEEELASTVRTMLEHDTGYHEQTRAELVTTVEERDRAIRMLELFRVEANAVIQKLYELLRESQDHARERLEEITLLKAENKRLMGAADAAEATDERGRAVSELNEMLVQMDSIIINLRSHNESLVQQNAALREQVRTLESTDRQTSDEDSVAALREALRREKQQRLEAEEQSHRLLSEHHKNVSLLEQRLRNTPRVAAAVTPGHGGVSTPHAAPSPTFPAPAGPSSSASTNNRSAQKVGQDRDVDTTSPLAAQRRLEMASESPTGTRQPQSPPHSRTASLDGEVRGRLNGRPVDESDAGGNDAVGGGIPSEPFSSEDPASSTPMGLVQRERSVSNRAPSVSLTADDHALNMQELRDIERQLQEVAASLGD